MENSYCFFENRDCKYFPCHEGLEDFNCLFCYCPFYLRERCPGKPEWLNIDGKFIKDCTNCNFPHKPESYTGSLNWIRRENEKREVSDHIRSIAKVVHRLKEEDRHGNSGKDEEQKAQE